MKSFREKKILIGGSLHSSYILVALMASTQVGPSFARPARGESCSRNVTHNPKELHGSSNFDSFFFIKPHNRAPRSRFSRYRVTQCTLLQLADTHVTPWKKMQKEHGEEKKERGIIQ